MKRAFCLLSCVLLCAGCCVTRQVTWSDLTHPDGTKERRKATSHSYAWGDARQTIDKVRVANGKTLGIGLADTEQNVTSTNMVQSLSELRQIIQLLAK